MSCFDPMFCGKLEKNGKRNHTSNVCITTPQSVRSKEINPRRKYASQEKLRRGALRARSSFRRVDDRVPYCSRPSPTTTILLLSGDHAKSRIGPLIAGYSYFRRCSFCVVSQMRTLPLASCNRINRHTQIQRIKLMVRQRGGQH